MGIHFFVLLDRANLLRPFLGAPLDFSSVIFALTVPRLLLKNPMAKWSKLWFVFDNETVYLLNNENADTVDDIKPSTKYFCGNKVSYKITPYTPK